MQESTPYRKLVALIRQRQVAEGNSPCFASEDSYACSNKECCWSHECFDEAVDNRLSKDFVKSN